MMERNEIEVLLTLSEELHFTRTAQRLHISTAAVSQIVRRVERRLGTTLFTRTTRHVELTDAGRRLVDELQLAHEQIQDAVTRAVDAGRKIAARLRIGYMSAAIGHQLLGLIDSFERSHPGYEVSITETALTDLFGPLRRAEVDLCILPLPVREDDLTVGPVLMTEPAVIAVASGHRLTRRTTVSPEDLRGETILGVRHLPPYWTQHHAAGDRQPATGDPTLPAKKPDVSGFQELLTFVAAGRGVAVVGAQSAAYYTRPGLTCLPCADLPPFEYAVVWRTAVRNANTTAFVRHASHLNKTC
ncbi:MAG: LysR family transcriptional regulator [Pseudonocardiales bacterium]|nr:MAG: LysR family transcriptional regulator [Pseudonocardiales bacterium]